MDSPYRSTGFLLAAVLGLSGAGLADGAKEVTIFVYAAYGTPDAIYVQGRALRKKSREPPMSGDSVWSNLWRLAGDLESDEVPKLPLVATGGGSSAAAVTDEEGLFEIVLRAKAPGRFDPADPPTIEVRVADPKKKFKGEPAKVTPAILPVGGVLIVSDIDDTIVRTEVTDKSKMIAGILSKNALQVQPIPGVAELYTKLNGSATPRIPVFYLSGSPINFFLRLVAFLEHQKFPFGPMFLKNLGLTKADPLMEQKEYKLKRLQLLAERLPNTTFILFGDSGEQDTEIYTTFRKEHAKRASAVFIRRVDSTPKSEKVLDGVFRTEDAFDAARKLVRMGLLSAADAEVVGHAVWGENPIPRELMRDLADAAKEAGVKARSAAGSPGK